MRIGNAASLLFMAAVLSSSASALPDLNVTLYFGDYSPHVGDTFYVGVTTHNGGNSTANTSHTVSFDGNTQVYLFTIPSLAPGEAHWDNYSFTCTQAGTFYFNATADFWREVNESNEYNNDDFASVYCAPAQNQTLPDLIVQDIAFSNNNPRVGDTFTVFVTTKNAGDAWATNSVTELTHNNGLVDFAVMGLNPGQNVTNTTTYTCNQTGTVYFSASADRFNAVNESNETNNYRQETLYCAPSQQQLPDLVSLITLNNTSPHVGDRINIRVNTTNYGANYSPSTHSTSFVTNGTHVYWQEFWSVPPLPPWEGYQIHDYQFTCPYQGTFYINASADVWNEANESNESNNNAYASVYCAPAQTPPPVIYNVSAINITYNSAKIRWYTDVPSDSRVEYGTQSGNYTYAAGSPLNTTYHLIPLSGLRPNTRYYYRVRSCAPAGNCAYSSEYWFRTLRKPTGGSPMLVTQVKPGQTADTGLVALAKVLKTSLQQEASELDAVQAQQFQGAAAAVEALPASVQVGRLQDLRMAVKAAVDAKNANSAIISAIFVGAAAVASAWFFWDKRKMKIRARMKGKK